MAVGKREQGKTKTKYFPTSEEKESPSIWFVVCHDSVDFVTAESRLSRLGRHSESYERIERRDSQEFYKFVMRRDFQSSRYGMKAIVERFGDPRTKAQYKDSAQGLSSIRMCQESDNSNNIQTKPDCDNYSETFLI